MAVIWILSAIIVPIPPPITIADSIQEYETTFGFNKVVTIAIVIPAMPNRFPFLEDAGEAKPLKAKMKQIDATR